MGNNGSHNPANGERCVICQESVQDNVSRPECCPNHFFHHNCLMEWAKHKNTCPLDNKEFCAVVDKRGKRIEIKKPVDDNIERLSTLFAHMLALHQIVQRSRFNCSVCDQECSELERSRTDVCDHRFHRKCLAQLARISNVCPIDDCNSEFSEVRCEFGETMLASDLLQPFKCKLCKKEIGDEETATADGCTHRFHRRCLHSHAERNKTCPLSDCGSDIRFLKCENGDRVVIQNIFPPFECSLCHQNDKGKEAARIGACGHTFHRECILSRYHNIENCPIETCNAQIDTIACQFGDTFEKIENPFNRLIASVTCDNDFQCQICHTKNEELERGKLPCGCEFHRRCIIQVARLQDELLCPTCRQEYSRIQCLFGDTLTVQKRTRDSVNTGQDSSSRDSQPGIPIPSNLPLVSASEEEGSNDRGAAGGSESVRHTCSLCDSPIDQAEGAHPDSCSHWYHRVCIISISSDIGCCICCQASIAKVVDEDGEEISTGSGPSEGRSSVNNDLARCYTCGDPIPLREVVRPDGCTCIFHRQCLLKIKEIMSFCPICNKDMNHVVDLA